MAKQVNRLTTAALSKACRPGLHADGGGLYLQVTAAGARSWVCRYTFDGRRREMGLGPLSAVDLRSARAKAAEVRRQVHDEVDPIEHRRDERRARAAARRRATTFDAAAEAYFATYAPTWKNPAQAAYWKRVMTAYASPVIGNLSVEEIDTDAVLRVLEPIWTAKIDTAVRVRDRVGQVLDWACARGLRTGENPARWKGHLDKLLPGPHKLRKRAHHAALTYRELPALMRQLDRLSSTGRTALKFLILTGVRSGEARGARWSEFDLDRAVWTIAPERMKSGRSHRVPLSKPAMDILQAQRGKTSGDLVFPGADPVRGLSLFTFGAMLRTEGRGDITVHGFRSTFRDWVAEETQHANEVAEMALAHAVPNAVEAAYRRGDMFDRRRALMDDWAAYCMSAPPLEPQLRGRRARGKSNTTHTRVNVTERAQC